MTGRNAKNKSIKSEGLAARMTEKKEIVSKKRKKVAIVIVCAVLLVGVLYGRSIIKLKAENAKLQKQQEELTKQRNEIKQELKDVNSKEYIKEEARRQLRLLNPGEIMFLFKDSGESDTKDSGNQ